MGGKAFKSEEELILEAFAMALRTLRKRTGLSQEKLALEGVNRSYVSDMERGRRDPRLTMMIRLCGLLNIPLLTLAREIERNYERLKEKQSGPSK